MALTSTNVDQQAEQQKRQNNFHSKLSYCFNFILRECIAYSFHLKGCYEHEGRQQVPGTKNKANI